eukprot:2402425-Rhodomonas_salina.1
MPPPPQQPPPQQPQQQQPQQPYGYPPQGAYPPQQQQPGPCLSLSLLPLFLSLSLSLFVLWSLSSFSSSSTDPLFASSSLSSSSLSCSSSSPPLLLLFLLLCLRLRSSCPAGQPPIPYAPILNVRTDLAYGGLSAYATPDLAYHATAVLCDAGPASICPAVLSSVGCYAALCTEGGHGAMERFVLRAGMVVQAPYNQPPPAAAPNPTPQ